MPLTSDQLCSGYDSSPRTPALIAACNGAEIRMSIWKLDIRCVLVYKLPYICCPWLHQFWKIECELILHSIRIISTNKFTNFSCYTLTWGKLFLTQKLFQSHFVIHEVQIQEKACNKRIFKINKCVKR